MATACALALSPATASAQEKKTNKGGKIYVSEINGEATIGTATTFEDVNKRAVYPAQGAVIETMPGAENAGDKSALTIVYSNGTAATFGADTRLEIKRFTQDPFTPKQSDLDQEPSASQTQAFVARGTVGVFTSKAAPGSTMVYQTPHGALSIRGRQVVIETGPTETKIAVLDGEGTFRGNTPQVGAHTVRAGEQATVQRNTADEGPKLQIATLSPAETAKLVGKLATADTARKTVYFVDRSAKVESGGAALAGAATAETELTDKALALDDIPGDGAVFTLDGPGGAAGAGPGTAPVRDLVPVEIVQPKLPTEYVVSPSTLSK
jgi:hypothetical protein